MARTRRRFLRILGGTTILAAAGAGAWLGTRTPTEAILPWEMAGSGYTDPRMRMLSYAILAPNPHNRQPWLVDLAEPDTITLYCDLERRLPETDPFDRQITIGLGCFLEGLALAASAEGQVAEITAFPEGEPTPRLDARPVATIRLSPGGAPDPLFAEIPRRHTNKEPFDVSQPVAPAELEALVAAAGADVTTSGTLDRDRIVTLRDLAWRAHMVEVETPRTLMESVDLMRIGRSEIEANPDGIDLGGPMLETLSVFGVLTRDQIADPTSQAFAQGLDMYREIIGSAMGFLWLATPDGRQHEIAAGRAWMRQALTASAAGLGLHPLSQALQEYPEMATLYEEIHQSLVPESGLRLQMFARLGYGPPVGPSPRWPVESRVRTA
ncbi:MAG: twin-arginine translocation pathway signal protein [Pseudomonadota bacterium]